MRRSNSEGTIRKRPDGRWEARIEVTLPSGEKARPSLYGKSRQEVQRKLASMRREQDAGALTFTGPLTVSAYLTQWWDNEDLRPKSLAARRVNVQRVAGLIGKKQLKQVTPADIRAIDKHLQGSGLGAYSRKQCFSVLRKAMRDAVVEGYVTTSPFSRLTWAPRVERKPMRVLDEGEIARLLAIEDRWRPLWVLLIATGLRSGEALALQWADIELAERGTVRVTRTLQQVNGEHVFGQPKTSSSRRTVDVRPHVVRALREHQAIQAEERLRVGPEWNDNNLVFTDSWGNPLYGSTAHKALQRSLKKAGIMHARVHDLRHTFATLHLSMGTSPKAISEALGHTTIVITLDLYAHAVPGMMADAANRMDDLLGRAMEA
jgi:integrase